MKKAILFCGICMAAVLMTAGCGADKSGEAEQTTIDQAEAVIGDQVSEEMTEDADAPEADKIEAAGSGKKDTISKDIISKDTVSEDETDIGSSDPESSDTADVLPEIEWAMDAKEETVQAPKASQQYDASKLKSIELTDYFGQNLYFVMDDFYPDIYQSSNCFMWNDMGSWVHVEDDGAICDHGHKINTSNVSVYGAKTGQSVDDAAAVLAARGFSIESEGLDSRINQYVVRAKGSKNWVVLYYDRDSKIVNGIEVNLKDLDQGWE